MSFPRSVSVGGHSLRVKWVDELPEDDWAEYRHDTKELVLSKRCKTETERWWSLLHEMIHSSLAIGGVSYILTDEQEEAVVRNIEHLFLPSLFRVLGIDLPLQE